MNLPPHLYASHGYSVGLDGTTVRRAVSEFTRLRGAGTYPILSLKHLSRLIGLNYHYLREVVTRERIPYNYVAIPKKTGGTRPISVPEPLLKEVQRWILDNVLNSLKIHPASYAYQEKLSILDCADQHRGSRWMIKLDLHNFFGNITESQIFRVFNSLGYSRLVAYELARLTTTPSVVSNKTIRFKYKVIKNYSKGPEGVLPQGAPTSGKLANAAARSLDKMLFAYATDHQFVYTRYSDDLIFSSSNDYDRNTAQQHLREITGLIAKFGFELHRNKTKIVPPGSRKIVLGLLVDNDVRLPPEFKRRIEVHLRGCQKFGLLEHSNHRNFVSVFSFVNHLQGMISFAANVENEKAVRWQSSLNEILEKAAIKV